MKREIKYLTGILLGVFLFTAAVRAENGVKVIFENVCPETSGLYVTKTVKPLEEAYLPPKEESFSFQLLLNQAAAGEQEYRLFEKEGVELFDYNGTITAEPKEGQLPTPFMTDENGFFWLKAEQTACFENLKAGTSYEIAETERDGYVQVLPAGGTSAVGTVTDEGTSVLFKNLYLPQTTETEKETELRIRKDIVFPSGYTIPETPEFTFSVEIKGKPWSHEAFTVLDTASGKEVSNGTTDENGTFLMKGNCTAVFRKVPADADYQVTEFPKDNWRAVTPAVRKGATKAPFTYLGFTNTQASFAVTKKMDESAVIEVPFTFTLQKGERLWSNAAYYLYRTNGQQVDSELHRTDVKGRFPLLPGQTAVFVGAEPGTVYSVAEMQDGGYIQTVPADVKGYRNKTVTESVEVLPFVNKLAPKENALSVTKLVKNMTGQAVPEGAVFTFRLLKKGESSDEPVADALYYVKNGQKTESYRTDKEGFFTLSEGQTARFEELEQEAVYLVEEPEESIPEGYTPEGDSAPREAVFCENPAVTFINRYGTPSPRLCLLKKGEDGVPLPDAVFELYADKEMTQLLCQAVSDENGVVDFGEPECEVCYIKEMISPNGYRLFSNPIRIELTNEGVAVNGMVYNQETKNPDVSFEETTDGMTVYVTVYNYRSFRLPVTGGSGIRRLILFCMAGLAAVILMAAVHSQA